MAIGSHQSHKMLKDEWLTPPWLFLHLPEFDLDPCAPIDRKWPMAKNHYTIEDDGLKKTWSGRVWLNPPYGRHTGVWLARLADHGNGIALIFARTETEMFREHVWEKADALLFFYGRLHFHHVNGERAKCNAGAPSVLIAYGRENADFLRDSKIYGKFVRL